jgi:hypothetical protein
MDPVLSHINAVQTSILILSSIYKCVFKKKAKSRQKVIKPLKVGLWLLIHFRRVGIPGQDPLKSLSFSLYS